jgi:hypothetical protein
MNPWLAAALIVGALSFLVALMFLLLLMLPYGCTRFVDKPRKK